MADTTYTIYPAIGIARVGTSDDYYIGPEVAGGLPLDRAGGRPIGPDQFRDGEGAIKRQAARFHLYRESGDGALPVTLEDAEIADIRWSVHLANKKASGYLFDPNPAMAGYAPNHPLRNPEVTDPAERRERLIIDPGPRTVSGAEAAAEFDRASTEGAERRFPPADLEPFAIDTLGGLRTDGSGRLLVLGGHGRAGVTPDKRGRTPNFANNDGWFDDTSDGPVRATVVLKDGTEIEATPAWVVVAPPAYAPQVCNLVTLYDTIFDTAVRKLGARPEIYHKGIWNKGAAGYRPHFEREIRPILERGEGYPWVVAIPPKPHRFDMALLGDPAPGLNGLRRRLLDFLRAPSQENVLINPSSGNVLMPYLGGDGAAYLPDDPALPAESRQTSKYARLTDTQYFLLEQWAEGWFSTGDGEPEHPGEALTRGVLDNASGAPFAPGIEMTWTCRLAELYRAPFRIRHRASVGYPLGLEWDPASGLEPGEVTRPMAIPWHTDFNQCGSETVDGRRVWWWPAQRPLFVYRKLKETIEPRETIQEYVDRGEIEQLPWLGIDYDMEADDFCRYDDDFKMVEGWRGQGFVYDEGEEGRPLLVEVARVEK